MKLIQVKPDASNLSSQKLNFFERAIMLASFSTERQKHGAIITSGRKVLGVGVNTFRNDPRTSDPRYLSYHAEINALRQLHKHYPSLTAYVVRINNQGELRYSQPCGECLLFLNSWNVKVVYFS